MKTELRFEEKEMPVASLGGEACVPDLSGEMILQNRLRFQLGEEDEIYEDMGGKKIPIPIPSEILIPGSSGLEK